MSLRLCTSTRRESLKVISTLLSDTTSVTKPLPRQGLRDRGRVGQQGRDHLQGLAARARAQPQGHAGPAAGGGGRRSPVERQAPGREGRQGQGAGCEGAGQAAGQGERGGRGG